MANHTTKKRFKLNHKKSIGTVIFIVEGNKDEIELLRKIFHKLLHYTVVSKKRHSTQPWNCDEYVSASNTSSRIIVLNTHNSSIRSVKDHASYRDEIYKNLVQKYNIDPKNSPVYYLWDRDRDSNPSTLVRSLVSQLSSAYDNKYYENGLLLLSYPALESYKISCRKNKPKKVVVSNVKQAKHSWVYRSQPTNANKLTFAAESMHQTLLDLGVLTDYNYDTDNFGAINQSIFKEQEALYKKRHGYRILSLLSIALIDLGIIEVVD